MRFRFPVTIFAFLACLGMAVSTLNAADAEFPQGSRAGLVPPKGFTPSTVFRGFQDADTKSVIVMFELPDAAFDEIEKANSIEAARKQGLTVEKREDFAIAGGKSLLFTGTEEAPGMKARKWLLFAKFSGLNIAVNVLIPEAAKDVYSNEAIRAALATIAVRAEPIEEKLGLLPFRVDDLAGFRVLDVADNRTLVLVDDTKDTSDISSNSRMIVGATATPQIPPAERGNFSRTLLANMPAFKDMRVTFAEPMRIGGQQGFEMRVDAKHTASSADVAIVQWVRFGAGGIIQMVGVSSKEKWAETFPRFRQVRDSVGPK